MAIYKLRAECSVIKHRNNPRCVFAVFYINLDRQILKRHVSCRWMDVKKAFITVVTIVNINYDFAVAAVNNNIRSGNRNYAFHAVFAYCKAFSCCFRP